MNVNLTMTVGHCPRGFLPIQHSKTPSHYSAWAKRAVLKLPGLGFEAPVVRVKSVSVRLASLEIHGLRQVPYYFLYGRTLFVSLGELKHCLIMSLDIDADNKNALAKLRDSKVYRIQQAGGNHESNMLALLYELLETGPVPGAQKPRDVLEHEKVKRVLLVEGIKNSHIVTRKIVSGVPVALVYV
jgi:hypothetical protein